METYKEQDSELIFALDIGTRSIVGVVGKPVEQRLKVLAVEVAEHGKRVMMDGQIDDINQVAALARTVTQRLESQLEVKLRRVCVAAAGRALRTQKGAFSLELAEGQPITQADISRLEAGAVSDAEEGVLKDAEERRQLFLVGYTVAQYRLDNYPLHTLLHHNGQKAEADVVATFLPGEVVESLYAAMNTAGLQVASMTLEPIAAMNAAIPADLRLLNLALVDIGAGTTDIAVCRDGSVVGYTMATVAGDEITEAIMKALLTDFQTAEMVKRSLTEEAGEITYTDVLGVEEQVSNQAVFAAIGEQIDRLAEAIAQQVVELNGGQPSALFLAGGGSKLGTLRGRVAKALGMDQKRVAIAGNNFGKSAFSDKVNLDNAELATPLGIAVSAGMGLLNDSYVVTLNGQPAKLFRSGTLTLQDILLMNGYVYGDMLGRTGASLSVTVDGRRITFRGEPAVPAILEVNGAQATVGTVINAGDEIRFVPAKHGGAASMTLAQLLGEDYSGQVLVNNQPARLERRLQTGDVVLTGGGWKGAPDESLPEQSPLPAKASNFSKEKARKEEPAQTPVQQAVRQNRVEDGQKSSPDAQVRSNLGSQPVTAAPESAVSMASESRPAAPAPAQQPERSMQQQPPVQAAAVEASPVFPLGKAAQLASFEGSGVGSAFFGGGKPAQPTVQPARKMLQIYLNNKPLILPPKAEGGPYYLMDLLEYSGIDFRALDRPVRLEVNGTESDFQREIKPGDSVTIVRI